MTKIKLTDINSDVVKEIFRVSMSRRTTKFMTKLTLTNDELLEVADLIHKEHHADARIFYSTIINSQKNFNKAVYERYVKILFNVESLLHLGMNTTELDDDNKAQFIRYAMTTSSYWFITYLTNEAKTELGIDVFNNPLHSLVMISKILELSPSKVSQNPTYIEVLSKCFESINGRALDMATSALKDASTYWKIELVKTWQEMPSNVVEALYNSVHEWGNAKTIALHPNTPDPILEKVFAETQDERYMPRTARDIFLF